MPRFALSRRNWPNVLVFSIVAITILFFVLIAGLQLNRTLVFDEIEWPLVAKGVVQHGLPVSYFGEDAFIRRYSTELMGYAAHYGLWHPPLYVYIVGLAFALVGPGTSSTRFVGVIAGILTLVMVVMAARRVAQDRNISVKATVVLTVVLCVVNPYFVQGILYVDIDNTILMPLVLFFLYAILSFDLSEPPVAARLVTPSLVFALTLWAKLTTPLLILATLGASYLLRKRWNAVLNLFVIGIVGCALFGVTWLAYATIFNVPPDFFLRFTFLQKVGYLEGGTGLSRVNSTAQLFFWITPPFAILFAAAGTRVLSPACAPKPKSFEHIWILSIASIAVFVGYTLWVPMIAGKYKVILVPLGALLSSILLVEHFKTKEEISLLRTVVWGGLCLVFYGLLVPDLMYVPPTISRAICSGKLERALADPRLPAWILSPLPLIIGPIFFSIRSSLRNWIGRFLIATLISAVAVGVVQNIRSARTEYSPLTFQIQPGFSQVVKRLDEKCGDGIVFAPKDIGYNLYPHCRVIPMDETEIFKFNSEADMLSVLQERTDIQWAVDSLSYPNLRLFPMVRAYMASGFDKVDVVGDFAIYRRKPAPK